MPPPQILSYLKGRRWDQLPADVQEHGNAEPWPARRTPNETEWAVPINQHEWRYVQRCWKTQSPGLVLIESRDQLLNDVAAITGDHSANGGVNFGTSFNFALDIGTASAEKIDINGIFNDTRRHLLLAKAGLRQIKTLHGHLPPELVDDFTDLEITLDEFFIGPLLPLTTSPWR